MDGRSHLLSEVWTNYYPTLTRGMNLATGAQVLACWIPSRSTGTTMQYRNDSAETTAVGELKARLLDCGASRWMGVDHWSRYAKTFWCVMFRTSFCLQRQPVQCDRDHPVHQEEGGVGVAMDWGSELDVCRAAGGVCRRWGHFLLGVVCGDLLAKEARCDARPDIQ